MAVAPVGRWRHLPNRRYYSFRTILEIAEAFRQFVKTHGFHSHPIPSRGKYSADARPGRRRTTVPSSGFSKKCITGRYEDWRPIGEASTNRIDQPRNRPAAT
ncbi:hypothetical protein [Azospirillum endophyticum]